MNLTNLEVMMPKKNGIKMEKTYHVSTTLPGCHYMQKVNQNNIWFLFDSRPQNISSAPIQFIEL